VKATTLSVDGLPGKNSISGLSVDKDDNVVAPLVFKDIGGNNIKSLIIGGKNDWKDGDKAWDFPVVIN